MDVNDYINSGIVELYAMNALPPAEREEFERMHSKHPEVKAELRKAEASLIQYVASFAVNPQPGLRRKIVGDTAVIQNANLPAGRKKQSDFTLTYKYLIAASIAALIVSTYSSWFFYSRWEEAETEGIEVLQDKNKLAGDYNVVKEIYDNLLIEYSVMRDENSDIILLNNPAEPGKHLARIYRNRINHRTYVDAVNLPAPLEGMQYQLWALTNGEYVDAGLLQFDKQGLQKVNDIDGVIKWIITLEPAGGSLTPNTRMIFLTSGVK